MEIRTREACRTDAAAIARVHVDSWRTTYPGIVPAAFLAELKFADSESIWSQTLAANRPGACMVVAETNAGEVVGFAYGAPEREGNLIYRGEIFAIYVLAEYQRQGIGRRLFSASVQHLRNAGFSSMLLWAFKDNRSARRFYESAGGEYVAEKTITIGGKDIVEVAYGWKDTAAVALE